ncbi:MAG: CpXC domain-containing protein [Deltaproteobacteria bacterium]|nr:CpXC domain-containing protein [Deltaproteobacteria bacterium]
MSISGTVKVRCPGCGSAHDAVLVQSINARDQPALVEKLLAGELNVLVCSCGRRTLLEATLLFHDPEHAYFCQACPGGEAAMASGARAFVTIAHSQATCRLVPSHNALFEKVLILRAGLDDAVLEVLKVLLLASRGDELDRVLLFAKVDRDAGHLIWQLPDQHRTIASPFDGYTKLAATLRATPAGELRIDRAWAIEAARALTESGS